MLQFFKKSVTLPLVIGLIFLTACGGGMGLPTLSESEIQLVEGCEVTLTADQTVEWSSSDDAIASVSQNGTVTAIKAGQAVITATAAGGAASCTVTVAKDGVTLSKEEIIMILGEKYALTASVVSGKSVSWSSDNNKVVTVDKEGNASAVGVGSAQICAEVRADLQAVCNVTVAAAEKNLVLTDIPDSLYEGGKMKLSPELTVLNRETQKIEKITDGFSFDSSNTATAAVTDDGEIEAYSAGKVKITVSHPRADAPAAFEIDIIGKLSDFDIFNEGHVNIYGRVLQENHENLPSWKFVNSGSGFEVRFIGSELKAKIASTCSLSPNVGYLKVFVDGEDAQRIPLDKGASFAEYTLARDLGEGLHVLRGYKVIEENYGSVWLAGFSETNVEFYSPAEKPQLKIEFYGDSITAGYGALGAPGNSHTAEFEDGTETYAFLASELLNAQADVLCMQGISLTVKGWREDYFMMEKFDCYSVMSNQKWEFQELADVVVIYLGTNDSYGISQKFGTAENFIDGYGEMIDNIREINPDASIICCYGMMDGDTLVRMPSKIWLRTII